MKELLADHVYAVLIAFLAVLGCFTAVSILGGDGTNTLRDVLLALAGALGGLAIGKKITP